jgi:dihydrofolate reductase
MEDDDQEGSAVRKLIVAEYLSLDGVVQAPGHAGEDPAGGFARGGWTGPYMADHGRYNSEFYQTAGGFLLGRLTYEIFAAYWPTVTNEGNEVARALNTLPKYVASTTLQQADWKGTTILKGDVPAAVADLRRQPGRPLVVVGSAQLAQTLLDADLVDEYQLWLHPIVLGSGKRLFRDAGAAAALRLVDSKTTSGGLVILTYGRAGAAPN